MISTLFAICPRTFVLKARLPAHRLPQLARSGVGPTVLELEDSLPLRTIFPGAFHG